MQWNRPESKHLIKNERRKNNKKKNRTNLHRSVTVDYWLRASADLAHRVESGGRCEVNARRVNCCAPRFKTNFVHYMLLAMPCSMLVFQWRIRQWAALHRWCHIFMAYVLLFAPRTPKMQRIACNSSETKMMDVKRSKCMPCDTTCNESFKWHGKIETTIIAINTNECSLSLRLRADS